MERATPRRTALGGLPRKVAAGGGAGARCASDVRRQRAKPTGGKRRAFRRTRARPRPAVGPADPLRQHFARRACGESRIDGVRDFGRSFPLIANGSRRSRRITPNGTRRLLPVFLGSLANRWTGLGKILRGHDRPKRDFGVEGEKPRLSDRRNLRCVLHVENDGARPIAAVVR